MICHDWDPEMLIARLKDEKFIASFWQLVRFGIVGVAATLTQYFLALFFAHVGVPLLVANPAAFVVAFIVSFSGPSFLDLSQQGAGGTQHGAVPGRGVGRPGDKRACAAGPWFILASAAVSR